MSNLLEILITSDSDNNLWTCSVWDPNNGTSLMSYKCGSTAQARTLNFVGNDYLLAADKTKPLLHIWPLNSQQTVQGMRFVIPGIANAVAVSKDGAYCVVGIGEKIYLWQMSSGELMSIISTHYQNVMILKFTPDGRYFVSAAEDGMVMVWSLATVTARSDVELATQIQAGRHDALHTFTDHSLPVSDIYVSKLGMQGRLTTVSCDHTCKIYDLTTGEMLLNLIFDVALTAVTLDVLELNVFVGTRAGNIHQFSLTNPPRTKDVTINEEPTFVGHSKGVTSLSASLDGETLMSGSNDATVQLWHIRSKQSVKVIKHKGSITNAFFTLNIPTIYKQNFSPNIILHNLNKTMETEILEIEIITKKKSNFWPVRKDIHYLEKEVEIVPENKTVNKNNGAELVKEIENLKKINAELYAFSIEKALQPDPIPLAQGSKKKRKRNRF